MSWGERPPQLTRPRLCGGVVRLSAGAGHAWLYATTLQAPIRNPAALPLLRGIGARVVGSVAEHYDGVGEVISDLHLAPLSTALNVLRSVPLGLRIAATTSALAA